MFNLNSLDRLFVVWASLFQIVLIAHFALRKPFFESYTTNFGWEASFGSLLYIPCIPDL